MNLGLGKVLRALMTAGLLLLVSWKAGLWTPAGREQLAALFVGASPAFLLLSILIQFILNYASSFKWWMLLRSRGIRISSARLCAYYFIGLFYNLLLPTSMGGDVVRVHELRRHTGQGTEAVASVFVERFTGMITLVVFALVAVLINLRQFNLPLITYSLLFLSILILVIGWLVLDARPLRLADAMIRHFLPLLLPLLGKLHKIQLSVQHYRHDRGALAVAFGNSLLFHLLAVLNVWLAARVFADDMTMAAALVATPVIMLLMNLPVSIGGIGLLEFAYTFTFELLGLGSALGLSVALLMRSKTLMDAVLGAICHPLLLRGRDLSREIADDVVHGTSTEKTP